MLTKEEELFIKYWYENRQKKARLYTQILPGIRVGFLISSAILALVFSGWYERAQMQFHAKTPAWLLILAIMLLTTFCGIFIGKFKWEQLEQQYRELLERQQSESKEQ
jgi:high-affinity Fe2+/Pb2+ permease